MSLVERAEVCGQLIAFAAQFPFIRPIDLAVQESLHRPSQKRFRLGFFFRHLWGFSASCSSVEDHQAGQRDELKDYKNQIILFS